MEVVVYCFAVSLLAVAVLAVAFPLLNRFDVCASETLSQCEAIHRIHPTIRPAESLRRKVSLYFCRFVFIIVVSTGMGENLCIAAIAADFLVLPQFARAWVVEIVCRFYF